MALSTIALVLLVSAIGTTTASDSNGLQWKPRPRVEYEFELNGRSLAGLPALQGQYSGVQYGGRVRVQGLTADTAIIRLEKMSWSALHARMQSGWWSADPQGNESLSGHAHLGNIPMPLSGSAALARFHDGQVQTVLVSREARDWEVNLLQGVLGHMQIQGASGSSSSSSSGANSLHGKSQPAEQGVYRVLENGVSGRCMVQYEVAPANAPAQVSAAEARMCAGKPYVQITKTKNFTDCEQHAAQSRGLPRCSPAGNSCASLWARNTLTQLIGCGAGADLQLVQAVSSSSMQAELQARADSRAVVDSSVNMTLIRVQAVRERIPTPKDGVAINGLGYRVAGKQVNGDWGLDSDYSNSSEEDDNSVEVVRHSHQQQQQQHQDSSSDSSDSSSSSSNESDNTSESKSSSSSSSAQQHKKNHAANSHKKNHSSDNESNDSSSNSRKHSQKHKQQQQDSSEQDDSSTSRKHSLKHKKQQDSSEQDDSSSSNNNRRHSLKQHKYQQDDDSSSSSSSRKHKFQQDSSEHKKEHGKHSRKPRSAKASKGHGSDDADAASVEDVFAGVLSPASVQKNATLRAALQQRVVADVTRAGAELRRQDGPSPRTMERVAMAIRVARALSADQLRAIRDQVHDQAAKDLFRDILAMCGSTPCVQETVTLIKERKMTALAAQMALSTLAERVSVPTRTILKYIQDLYQSANSDQQQVKIAAALAIGNLAGRAARPIASSAAAFLAEQLAREADKAGSMRAPLTAALGSTASPEAARALVKAAKDAKLAPYQRAQAVLALRSPAARAPAVVRDALLSLFHAPTEPAAVRMAAVSLLVYLRPSLPLWQRLAVSTHYEPNLAVASYVWATIYSFAQLQDPTFRQQTQFARLALPLARRLPEGAHLAFNVVSASVDARLDRLVHDHASFMSSADAANAYYRRVTHRAGVSTVDQEVDVWGANPDDLLQAAMDAVLGRKDKAAARPALEAKAIPFHSTKSIHDKLNIVRRRLQDPQGHLRLTLKPFFNNMFLTFNKDTPSYIAKAATQYMEKLRSETSFHAQQMGGEEVSMATVTEMGFPVNLRIQAPWLLRAEGSAQLHRNLSAEANITCLYTSGLIAQLSVQPSWSSREYVAAVNGHALIQLPATTVRAQVDATDGRVSVVLEPGHRDVTTVLARVGTQPLTASRDLSRGELASESATCHNASHNVPLVAAPEVVELSPWDDISLGLRAPVEKNALAAWLRESRTVLGFPVLGRPLTASRLELVASRPRAVNATFAMVKAMMQSGDLRVVFPASLRWEDAADQPADAATTTDNPVTSTTTTTTAAPEDYATTTTTTAAPTVVRAARASNENSRHRGNGSMFVDDGDLDFSRSVFNATLLNPYSNRINGSGELYVLSQVLGGMTAGRGYVVGVNVTTEATPESAASSYSGFWTFGANLGGRLIRAGLFGRSDADNAQVAATGAVLKGVPARTDIGDALQQLPALMVKAEYQQISAKAVKKILTAAMETDRSATKTQRLWQSAKEQHCVSHEHAAKDASVAVTRACRQILGAANTPDQFNVTLNYNSPAEESWGAAVHTALQAARAYFWNQGNVAVDTLASGTTNELGAGITVQADGSLDGWLQTPRTLTKMTAADAPVFATLMKVASQETGAYCGVSNSRLVTLDGARGAFSLGECWHLLAKDCSGKSRVAVLAKAEKGHPAAADAILVEVNVDNYQVARLHPDGYVSVNGESVASSTDQAGAAVQVRDADDVSVMSIVRAEDGALSVHLPDHGMTVVYGNSSVVIQAGASLRGRLCGMCGNFDGVSAGDMLNPSNKAEKTVQAFADSYAIKDAQCGSGKGRQ